MVSCRPSVQQQWSAAGVSRQNKLFKSTQANDVTNQQQTISGGKQRLNGGKRGHQDSQGSHDGSRKGKDTQHRYRKSRRSWRWKAGASWTILSVLDWWLLAAGGWLTWRGVFLKWTPLGICFIAAVQWQRGRGQFEDPTGNQLCRTASQWQASNRHTCASSFLCNMLFVNSQTNVYCSLPLRVVSRGWGWLAECRVPIPIRPLVYGCYSAAFGVNLSEAAIPDFK